MYMIPNINFEVADREAQYPRSATRGHWVILVMKTAVRAADNSGYAIFLCRDQKFQLPYWMLILS